MKQGKKILKHLLDTDVIKTLRFNFHYFPFRKAIRIPVLVARKTVFVKLSGQVLIKDGCRLYLGYRIISIQDSKLSRTMWDVTGSVFFMGDAIIGRGSKLSIGGELTVGPSFKITGDSTIICGRSITIGNDVLISWECLIMDTDFHSIKSINGSYFEKKKPIFIGDHVWVGCRSTILKGSMIPERSIVAAGSLISKNLTKANCIYGANGIVLKEGVEWFH